jgi:hypothetical protein
MKFMHVPIQKMKDIKEIGDHNPHISNNFSEQTQKGCIFLGEKSQSLISNTSLEQKQNYSMAGVKE